MKKKQDLRFTFINYSICNYCEYLVRYGTRDGWHTGCELIKNEDGQYAAGVMCKKDIKKLQEKGIDAVWNMAGCSKFESSGLPAHPQVLEELIKKNKLAKSIPSNKSAIETSYDFGHKITKFNKKEIRNMILITKNGKQEYIKSIQ